MEVMDTLEEIDPDSPYHDGNNLITDGRPGVPEVGFDEAYLSPAATRHKIRSELLPMAFENYRTDLASTNSNLRHRASKEIMELAGLSPKMSAPQAGATFNLPPAAIAKMVSGVVDLFRDQDVQYEVIDVTPESEVSEEDDPTDYEVTSAMEAVPGGDPEETRLPEEPPTSREVAESPGPPNPSSFIYDPGDDAEGEWA